MARPTIRHVLPTGLAIGFGIGRGNGTSGVLRDYPFAVRVLAGAAVAGAFALAVFAVTVRLRRRKGPPGPPT
jgi:hypothetical protein